MAVKLPKKLIHKHCRSSYLVTIDKHQRESVSIKGEGGKELNLHLPKTFDRNFRTKNVNECKVIIAFGDADFKEGDTLRVNHWLFQNEEGNFKDPLLTVDGVDYYKVDDTTQDKARNIYWGLRDNKRILPKDVFIVEYLEYKNKSSITLMQSFSGRRRDVFRILEVPENETDYKIGDLVLTSDGADYELDDSKGKHAMILKDRIWAKVETEDWMLSKYRPFKNHYKDITR